MPTTCPDCGAILEDGNSCQSIFDSFLVLEFTDPAFGEVHFLTVACFMIQHGRYSNAGLTWIHNTLKEYLEKDLTPGQLRKLARHDTSSRARTWKVNRATEDPPLSKIAWSMTIADIAANYKDAVSYCDLIKQWARTAVREMEPWLTQSL